MYYTPELLDRNPLLGPSLMLLKSWRGGAIDLGDLATNIEYIRPSSLKQWRSVKVAAD
jgi:hypothetical protein